MTVESKIFTAIAHPDDETMMVHGLEHALASGVKVDLCVAVGGGAGNLYGMRAQDYLEQPLLDDSVAHRIAAGIRMSELVQAGRLYTNRGGTLNLKVLDLEDKGWRRGGLVGQEGELKRQIQTMLDGNYDAYIFPLSLPPHHAPSNWTHPDHVVLSNITDDPDIRDLIGKRPVFRFILYNELLPLQRLPETVTRVWKPEIWRYGPEGYKLLDKVIRQCYPSQAPTLRRILAQTRVDLSTQVYDVSNTAEYDEIGKKGPTPRLPFHEVIFARHDGPTYSEVFGLPRDVVKVEKTELSS